MREIKRYFQKLSEKQIFTYLHLSEVENDLERIIGIDLENPSFRLDPKFREFIVVTLYYFLILEYVQFHNNYINGLFPDYESGNLSKFFHENNELENN